MCAWNLNSKVAVASIGGWGGGHLGSCGSSEVGPGWAFMCWEWGGQALPWAEVGRGSQHPVDTVGTAFPPALVGTECVLRESCTGTLVQPPPPWPQQLL